MEVTDIKGKLGKPVSHESATQHVTGEARYIDDRLEYPGMLHIAVGKSSEAHALIQRLDLSRVKAAEGVVLVVTAADIPGENEVGNVYAGDPLFATNKVEFAGQALFAVAAATREQARKAVLLAEVEYCPLKPVLDPDDAEKKGLLLRPPHCQKVGDADNAIDDSAVQVEGNIKLGGQEHFYLEGQVAVAVPGEAGTMEVYASTQNPTENQKIVADVLGVSRNKVVVECRRMGGGFGGKESQAGPWICMAALVAQKTGRPAKLRLSRNDDMVLTGKRHPFSSHYRVGFDESGVIKGLKVKMNADGGFSPDLTESVVDRAMFDLGNAYFFENIQVTGNCCKTNKVSNTAFRGFGSPQGMATIESIIDVVAYRLGKDPLDVRKTNLMGFDSRNTTHYGQTVTHNRIGDIVTELEEKSLYRQRREDIIRFNDNSTLLKKGIALMPLNFGVAFSIPFLNQAGVLLHVYTDGSIHLNQGGTEMGQGLFTKVAQVVANEFQVDLDRVQVSSTRVDKVPNTSPTAGSMSSDLNGMAALNAAGTIKSRLITFASEFYQIPEAEISFADNYVQIGKNKMAFAELVELAYFSKVQLSAAGFYKAPDNPYDRKTGKGNPYFYFTQGAAVAEVMVDKLTGEYKVLRADLLVSLGQSLNPAIDIGQIEGGFIQGLGWVTSEELVWNNQGKLLTNGPATYKIPAVTDCPSEFNVAIADSGDEQTLLFRSKAIGEPPLLLSISVLSALRHAISCAVNKPGFVPDLNAPATPERVLRAIQSSNC